MASAHANKLTAIDAAFEVRVIRRHTQHARSSDDNLWLLRRHLHHLGLGSLHSVSRLLHHLRLHAVAHWERWHTWAHVVHGLLHRHGITHRLLHAHGHGGATGVGLGTAGFPVALQVDLATLAPFMVDLEPLVDAISSSQGRNLEGRLSNL